MCFLRFLCVNTQQALVHIRVNRNTATHTNNICVCKIRYAQKIATGLRTRKSTYAHSRTHAHAKLSARARTQTHVVVVVPVQRCKVSRECVDQMWTVSMQAQHQIAIVVTTFESLSVLNAQNIQYKSKMVRYTSHRRLSSWNIFYSWFAGEWRRGNRGNLGAGDSSEHNPKKMQQAASQAWRQLSADEKLKYAGRRLSAAGAKRGQGRARRATTGSPLPFRSRTVQLNSLLDILRAATLAGVNGAGRPLVTQLRRELRNWQDNVVGEIMRVEVVRNRPVVRLF